MNNRLNSRYCGCPKCDAVFIMTDEKRHQYAGMVRCGACQEAFDANTNLMQKTDNGFVPVGPEERFHEEVNSPPMSRNDGGESGEKSHPSQLNIKHAENEIEGIEISEVKNPFEHRVTDSIDDHADKQDHGQLSESYENDGDFKAPTIGPVDFDSDREGTPEQVYSYDSPTEVHQVESNGRPEDMYHKEFEFIDLEIDNPKDVEQESLGSSVSSPSQNSTPEAATLGKMSNNGVAQYINDNTNPFATFIWLIVITGFVFLLGMQVKYFFVERYAQDQTYRKYLTGFCKIAGCDLPPRQAPFQFTLTHTRIALHPTEPGALRVTVKLINEAKFAQPYPYLQLTLTDRAGRVVGRRTFSPELYLANGHNNASGNMVGQGELASIVFNLARPHEKAVGFVVDIVTESVSS